MVKKYKLKNPDIVEAIQYSAKTEFEIEHWSNREFVPSPVAEPDENNPSGRYLQYFGSIMGEVQVAIPGDYCVKFLDGEFMIVTKEEFEESYEEI